METKKRVIHKLVISENGFIEGRLLFGGKSRCGLVVDENRIKDFHKTWEGVNCPKCLKFKMHRFQRRK